MLTLAALFLAAASSTTSPALTSTSPWWEKVTYTISGDGAKQSCDYESSDAAVISAACDENPSAPIAASASGVTGAVTKITIERRFTPGDRPGPGNLEAGDTLLGGQVMELAIDGTGTVRSCDVLAASGDLRPAYGCEEVRAERFKASRARETAPLRHGLMTILVYGHEGQLA